MASAASSSSTYANSPCAACKFLRRKCLPDCIFAPYFPPEEPQKFANVHKIFGASNVSKLLNEVLPHQREDAVNSLAYEAEARLKDPVYGCVGAISVLQRQVIRLQKELDATNADLIRFAYGNANNTTITTIRNSSSSTATATTTATDQMMISSAGAYREDPSNAERSSSSILHQGGVYYGGNYGLWSGGIDEANGRGGGNGSF